MATLLELVSEIEKGQAKLERLLTEAEALQSQANGYLGDQPSWSPLPRSIPAGPLRDAAGRVNLLPDDIGSWKPTCESAMALTRAAAKFREYGTEGSHPITVSFETARLSKAKGDWDSKGGDDYAALIRDDHAVSAGMETFIKEGATALDAADKDINNWLMGALLYIAGALATAISLALAVVALFKELLPLLAGLGSLTIKEVLLVIGLVLEVKALLSALVAAIAAAFAFAVAVWAINDYIDNVYRSAAERITTVAASIDNSTPWRSPVGVPRADDW